MSEERNHPRRSGSAGEREEHVVRRSSQGGRRVSHSASGDSSPVRRSGQPGQEGERSGQTRRRRRGNPAFTALFYLIFVIGVSILLASFGWVMANDVLALNKEYHSAVIEVTDSDTIASVTKQLKEEGLIDHPLMFRLFSLITGGEDDLTAGTYELNTDMDYRAIILNMSARSSARQTTTVVIPEGYTVAQIFQLLEDNHVSTVEKLTDMAANYDYAFSFLQDIPLGEANRLEGYLFPDTYEFFLGQDPKTVINKMLVRFDAVVTDEMRQEIWDSGRTIHEVVTVASLIEKETDGTDYGTIASVIYNRLNNTSGETAGYLQIDAAIAYVTGRAVTREDYDNVDSPYNTYLNKGLTPGPISNPGLASIRAAMDPEDTKYYYYVLNPETNRHEFSRTYAEHQALVAKYSGS